MPPFLQLERNHQMLKLLSLFSGIGAFEKALENIGEPFEVVRYCEIDKYASKAYSLIHNLDENMNLKDVCSIKTEELPNDIDLITYGFPCQDISNAGKQKGFIDEQGNLTRSGLFFEALRIIEDTQPKVAIAENVKALVGKKFAAEFKIVLDSLNKAGYTNYWAVLNAKDYGIPQNRERERVFIISIRNDIAHGFNFPKKHELKLRLKDLLEDDVDEKYYLSDKMLDYVLSSGTKNFYYKPENDLDVARPLTTDQNKKAGTTNYVSESFVKDGLKTEIEDRVEVKQIGNLFPSKKRNNPNQGRLYDKNGISPTLNAMQGGNRQPFIIDEPMMPIKEATKKGYAEAHEGDYVNLQFPESKTRRGRVGEQCANTLLCNDANGVVTGAAMRGRNEDGSWKQQIEVSDREEANALTTVQKDSLVTTGLKIRKLTPKECFRLMGFDDKDCDVLTDNGISNSQIYKMAGNSICVDVLEELFVELLNQYDDVFPMGD